MMKEARILIKAMKNSSGQWWANSVTSNSCLLYTSAFAKPGLKRSESFFFRLVLLVGLALFCVGAVSYTHLDVYKRQV